MRKKTSPTPFAPFGRGWKGNPSTQRAWRPLENINFHFIPCANGNSRFGDDNQWPGHRLCNVPCGLIHIGQVSMAIPPARGGADRDEGGVGPRNAVFKIGRKGQSPGAYIGGNQFC